jgi:hypothetical protein
LGHAARGGGRPPVPDRPDSAPTPGSGGSLTAVSPHR